MTTPVLESLRIADDIEAWTGLGFAPDGPDTITVGTVALAFTGRDGSSGLCGWTLRGSGPADLDGLPTAWRTTAAPRPHATARHPNGTTALDHVVVMTPELERTSAALAAAGMELRRTREAGTPEQPLRQCFYVLGGTVLELVGDVEPAGPARFWGLVAVVPDLDVLYAQLGPELLGAPKDAVQPGRRIATVRRAAGPSVPLAFLTPRPSRN